MKTRLLTAILSMAIGFACAQPYREIVEKNAGLPFAEIVQRVEEYYAGKPKGRGSGYVQFKRWEHFNRYRLDARGKLVNVPELLLEKTEAYNQRAFTPPNLNFDCQWRQEGGNTYSMISSGHNGGLGRVNCIAVDPADANIIYAGTPAGGLWRTTNGGGAWAPGTGTLNWTPLTDGLPSIGVSGIAIDYSSPAANRTLYILTGDGDGGHTRSIGVLKSVDGGATWALTGLNTGAFTIGLGYKLLIHPTNPQILFAATDRGIFRTLNGGLTWTRPFGDERIVDIEFRPGTPNTMYAASTTTVYRSTDGGANWPALDSPLPGCDVTNIGVRLAIAVTPADPDYVYVVASGLIGGAAGTFQGLYRSTDGGDCFQLRSAAPNILGYATDGSDDSQQAFYDLTIAASPTDAEEVHVGGIQCWRSDDGGSTWTNTTNWFEPGAGAGNYNHADLHAMEYVGGVLYSGSDGGVYRTNNRGDDWVNISQGLIITQYYRIAAFNDGMTEYAAGGAQDNGLNQLVNTGAGFGNLEHWEGADGFEVSPDVAGDLMFGATQTGCLVKYSYPGGGVSGLTQPLTPVDGNCMGNWSTPHFYDAANNAFFTGYNDVYRSTDDGVTWANYSNGNIGLGNCDFMAQAPSNDDVLYVCKGTTLYRTVDNGATWSDVSLTLPNNNITYIAVDPANSNRVWVTMDGFSDTEKVFVTSNGGTTWTNITGSLPGIPATCIVYQNGSSDGLYVGMDVGVYYRDNTMTDWILFSNGLPNVIIGEMQINYTTNRIYAGTFGRGMWSSPLFNNCARICLDCPNFDEIHSQRNTYSSKTCILSESWVYQETDIEYKATTYIRLKPGFYVDARNEATFYGAISACSGSKHEDLARLSNTRGLSGFYVGKLDDLLDRAPDGEEMREGNDQAQPISLYPNPTDASLFVEFEAPFAGYIQTVLYNSSGDRVRQLSPEIPVEAGKFKQRFHLGDLPPGVYTIGIRLNDRQFFKRVVKM